MGTFEVVFHDYSVENDFNESGDGFSGPFAQVFSHYFKLILGPRQVNWTNGGDKGFCDEPICSSRFLRSVQSGHYDLGFPPLQMTIFNGLPVNITISPVVEDIAAIFLNLYTEKSFRSAHPGVLTSFKAIATNVYILVCILCAVGLAVYHIRSNAEYFYEERILRSRRSRHWLLQNLIKLINASFTTNYSITVMKPPVNTMEDLVQIDGKAAILEDIYCFEKLDKHIVDKYLIKLKAKPGEVVFPRYISENLNKERFFIFDGDEFTLSEARLFCNAMVNIKKTNNFNIIFGNKRYFDTLQALVYNNNIDNDKRQYIIRRSYSCLEMGICKDGFDATLDKIYTRPRIKLYSAQCIKIEQRESRKDTFQPIRFVNMYELLYLLLCLLGFSSIVFLIEICKFHISGRLDHYLYMI